MSSNDEAVSQFLAFTGSSDTSRAASYLEMAGGDLETAVGLFLEHDGQSAPITSSRATGTGSTNTNTPYYDTNNFDSSQSTIPLMGMGQGDDGIRAPDQTRRMRLLDFHDDDHPAPSSRFISHHPFFAGGMDNVFPTSVRDRMNAFAVDDHDVDLMDMDMAAAAASIRDLTSTSRSIRDVINASAAADASSSRMNDTSGSYHYDSDDEDNDEDYDDSNNHNDDGNEDIIDVEHVYESSAPTTHHRQGPARLHDLFSPPTHLIHSAGGFQGARSVAKDAKRWLLVNLQSDSDFACHALNRDVWRDELVENLIREGFIFWQSINTSSDGVTYAHRYKVENFPHISIIDPRTGRLIWRKEGWTQQNPLTAADFAEKVIDFCSQHSLDEPPTAPAKLPAMKNHHPVSENTTSHTLTPSMGFEPPMKRPMHEMTEEQQLQAAIRASMNESNRQITIDDEDYVYINSDQDEADVVESVQKYKTDDVSVVVDDNTKTDSEQNTHETNKPITFEDEILSMDVGEEPSSGTDDIAGIMFRMPNGKRLVRNFSVHDTVKKIYAFVAQSCDGEDSGKPFELKAKYPPKDLIDNISETILDTGLLRETITVRWKN